MSAPTSTRTYARIGRFPARVGDAVARDTTVTFGSGTVGRRERGGRMKFRRGTGGGQQCLPCIRSRTYTRACVNRQACTQVRDTQNSRRDNHSHTKGERRNGAGGSGRPNGNSNKKCESPSSRGGDSIHARASDVSPICIYDTRNGGGPLRGVTASAPQRTT